eukprot:6210686-Pleurochrysis_carterae.AAC.5
MAQNARGVRAREAHGKKARETSAKLCTEAEARPLDERVRGEAVQAMARCCANAARLAATSSSSVPKSARTDQETTCRRFTHVRSS